jgi:hypothetical protein
MITTILDRDKAERFASLLDRAAAPTRSESLSPLLTVTRSLRQVPVNGDIDPEFRERLRGRLVAVATVRPPAAPEQRAAEPASGGRLRRARVPRRAGVLGSVLVALLGVCGVVTASSSAAPGSPLYGIKRATESAQLALASGDVARGRLQFGFARTRLDEAQQVHGDRTQLTDVLSAMDASTREGSQLLTGVAVGNQDRSPLVGVDGFLRSQRPDVLALLPTLTDPRSHQRAAQSLALLDRLQARLTALRSSLPCPTPVPLAADDLGPRLAACGHGPDGAAANAVTHGVRPGKSRPDAGTPSAGPTSSASPEPMTGSGAGGTGLPGLPGLPRLPGIPGLPGLPGTVPTPQSANSPPDVGSAVTGLLGRVLSTIGVSPPSP